jgi:hypothetical protein
MANLGVSIGKQFPSPMDPQLGASPSAWPRLSVLGLDAALGIVLQLAPFRSDVPTGSRWAPHLKTCVRTEEFL